MDIGLNEFLDLELDDRNDLPTVTGRQEFEQRLTFSINSAVSGVIGRTSDEQITKLMRMHARRVVDQFEEIERVVQIRAGRDENQPNTFNLTIIYDTGDEFSRNFSE